MRARSKGRAGLVVELQGPVELGAEASPATRPRQRAASASAGRAPLLSAWAVCAAASALASARPAAAHVGLDQVGGPRNDRWILEPESPARTWACSSCSIASAARRGRARESRGAASDHTRALPKPTGSAISTPRSASARASTRGLGRRGCGRGRSARSSGARAGPRRRRSRPRRRRRAPRHPTHPAGRRRRRPEAETTAGFRASGSARAEAARRSGLLEQQGLVARGQAAHERERNDCAAAETGSTSASRSPAWSSASAASAVRPLSARPMPWIERAWQRT